MPRRKKDDHSSDDEPTGNRKVKPLKADARRDSINGWRTNLRSKSPSHRRPDTNNDSSNKRNGFFTGYNKSSNTDSDDDIRGNDLKVRKHSFWKMRGKSSRIDTSDDDLPAGKSKKKAGKKSLQQEQAPDVKPNLVGSLFRRQYDDDDDDDSNDGLSDDHTVDTMSTAQIQRGMLGALLDQQREQQDLDSRRSNQMAALMEDHSLADMSVFSHRSTKHLSHHQRQFHLDDDSVMNGSFNKSITLTPEEHETKEKRPWRRQSELRRGSRLMCGATAAAAAAAALDFRRSVSLDSSILGGPDDDDDEEDHDLLPGYKPPKELAQLRKHDHNGQFDDVWKDNNASVRFGTMKTKRSMIDAAAALLSSQDEGTDDEDDDDEDKNFFADNKKRRQTYGRGLKIKNQYELQMIDQMCEEEDEKKKKKKKKSDKKGSGRGSVTASETESTGKQEDLPGMRKNRPKQFNDLFDERSDDDMEEGKKGKKKSKKKEKKSKRKDVDSETSPEGSSKQRRKDKAYASTSEDSLGSSGKRKKKSSKSSEEDDDDLRHSSRKGRRKKKDEEIESKNSSTKSPKKDKKKKKSSRDDKSNGSDEIPGRSKKSSKSRDDSVDKSSSKDKKKSSKKKNSDSNAFECAPWGESNMLHDKLSRINEQMSEKKHSSKSKSSNGTGATMETQSSSSLESADPSSNHTPEPKRPTRGRSMAVGVLSRMQQAAYSGDADLIVPKQPSRSKSAVPDYARPGGSDKKSKHRKSKDRQNDGGWVDFPTNSDEEFGEQRRRPSSAAAEEKKSKKKKKKSSYDSSGEPDPTETLKKSKKKRDEKQATDLPLKKRAMSIQPGAAALGRPGRLGDRKEERRRSKSLHPTTEETKRARSKSMVPSHRAKEVHHEAPDFFDFGNGERQKTTNYSDDDDLLANVVVKKKTSSDKGKKKKKSRD